MRGDTPARGNTAHRDIPSVDYLLRQLEPETQQWGRPRLTAALRELLDTLRAQIHAGHHPDLSLGAMRSALLTRLEAAQQSSLKPVFNLTGTVLHTNLGRAGLPVEALDAITHIAGGASNLEFDLEKGNRGRRESHVAPLICALTGAEAATVVNNNAAAVLLVLNTLALGREVPVSRGELVEIGGSFRIPDVMQRSGCTLVEVGATNRTHPADYRAAICERTALLMKVHASNYRVEGFTHEVGARELATLAHAHDLPLVMDLGSGNLADFASLGLPPEPTVQAVLESGADLVTFSGDKLLGGPPGRYYRGTCRPGGRYRKQSAEAGTAPG